MISSECNYTLWFYFHTVSPPIVTVDPSNVIAKVHQNITFVCSAVGLGDFLFVWEHDDEVTSAALSTLQHATFPHYSFSPATTSRPVQVYCYIILLKLDLRSICYTTACW